MEKELRKMNHAELVEIIYVLQQNENDLLGEIEELRSKVNEKTICIEKAGSIAEAALQLNHLFEDAQSAAEQFLLSVKDVHKEETAILEKANEKAEAILQEANEKAAAILQEANEKADATLQETQKEAERMVEEAEAIKRESLLVDEAVKRQQKMFIHQTTRILTHNPELAEKLKRTLEEI